MNVATITMPTHEAKERLAAYRRAVHQKADTEYQAIASGYEKLAQGKPLLNLADAFREVPLDDKGRPRLAIARADQKQVKVVCHHDAARFATNWNVWRRGRPARGERAVEHRLERPGMRSNGADGYSLVPIIPPLIRGRHDLGRCHILWEVEQWADAPIRSVPDRDPLLLRLLGGDLWVVLGEWDLTDLERAVMAGRRVG